VLIFLRSKLEKDRHSPIKSEESQHIPIKRSAQSNKTEEDWHSLIEMSLSSYAVWSPTTTTTTTTMVTQQSHVSLSVWIHYAHVCSG